MLLLFIVFLALGAQVALDMMIGNSDVTDLSMIISAIGGIFQLIVLIFVLPWLYFAFMESGAKQSTLGKRWLGMKVTNENGRRISFGLASGRYFAKNFLSGILLIGFLMALFTEKRQALHDKLAETLIIYSGGR